MVSHYIVFVVVSRNRKNQDPERKVTKDREEEISNYHTGMCLCVSHENIIIHNNNNNNT